MTRALAIALCALGCDGGGPTAAERSLLGQLLLGPLPPDPTNAVADDERAPDVTTIDALMRKPINSTMSQLAYALYHDPGDPARRFELVADHAARLLASMKENALGLRTAALEGDAAGARHWFAHLKQDCAACHSRFRVEVPRAEVLPRWAGRRTLARNMAYTLHPIPTDGGGGIANARWMGMQRAEQTSLPLLLVDDTPANLVALKAILDGPAYRLFTASSGEEALRIVERENIGIILLDVVMPGMDGFEVAARLKAMPDKRLIPILFLTAVATDINYVYRAYDVGAVDYLVKPLDSVMVRKKVAVFVELVRQREQIERHGAELHELQRREYELRIAELRMAGDRRYRKLVDGIDHAIAWTADESLRLTFVSRQASMILGYPVEDFLHRDFWADHLHPEDKETVLALFRRALVEGCDLVCNHRLLASDGRTVWFHTGMSGERGVGSVPTELHGFSVDVTDLKNAEERARRATQARDDLLAVVSHDLRNPLNSIKLSAGMLGREIANPEDAPRAFKQVATIVRAAERMERLIGELLDLAQLEAGGLAIDKKAVDAAALINDSLELLRPAAVEKRLHLEGESTPGIFALADRDRVLQIMSNLVGNAVKFTPEGGWILVSVVRNDGEALFTVSDTGPGIAPENLPHIWGRFWQSKRDGGVGLGLTIAKAIVEAHGGRIWAETQVGSGTTFHFTLPLAGDADHDRPNAPP